jgi:hypothetical protein
MGYFNMPHFDWLERQGIKLSPFGREVAYIVGCTFGGIYNAPIEHKRTNWSDERCIEIITQRDLATWDFNQLTLLTLFAHEMCIRIDVDPVVQFYRWNDDVEESQRIAIVERSDDTPINGDWCEPCLRIWFHKRQSREGSIGERHPTMEQALENFQASYKHPDKIWDAVKDGVA